MKKAKKPKTGIPGISGHHSNKTYRDLKREAVIRGMPFPDATAAGINDLISWVNNSTEKPDLTLIDKYDEWADKQLEVCGYQQGKSLRHPSLRLGFIGKDEEGKTKIKRIKGLPKPKKPKRERDENNLYKGTKKSYTFELAKKGLALERVIRRVLKKYPDASEKSIKIWYRTASKG